MSPVYTVKSPLRGHRILQVAHNSPPTGQVACPYWAERLPLLGWRFSTATARASFKQPAFIIEKASLKSLEIDPWVFQIDPWVSRIDPWVSRIDRLIPHPLACNFVLFTNLNCSQLPPIQIFAICDLFQVERWGLRVEGFSPIIYHLSPITYPLSPITYPLSPIIYHLSPIPYHL